MFYHRIERVIRRAVAILAGSCALTVQAAPSPDVAACMAEALATAAESTTVGELRAQCERRVSGVEPVLEEKSLRKVPVYEQLSALDERLAAEAEVEGQAYVITPKRPNYLMWTVMDSPNQAPFEEATGFDDPLENEEMQFQVSIKAPVWRGMFGTDIDTYVAYTSRSYWQLFADDDELSAPFRETNYEPEVYLRGPADIDLFGAEIRSWSFGFNHQSNGRSEPLSRSWNRIMGESVVALGDEFNLLLRAWYRLPEDEDEDDNPKMERYLGYGDARLSWTPNRNTFTAMLRPGTRETGFELTWSYPISEVFRIYAQYYNGYGDNLIDYDADIERFGIGIALNDYLQR